jgi:hypothetical protein
LPIRKGIQGFAKAKRKNFSKKDEVGAIHQRY